MKKCIIFLLSAWVLLGQTLWAQAPQPPKAERKPHVIHGTFGDREDPYFWLNDRENPKVIDYLKAENAYQEQIMAPTAGLQEKLFTEMVGRIKEDDESVPYQKGDYWYYTRYEKGGEYPIACRKKGSLDAKEEIIVDGNELAKGKDYLSFYIEVSPDQTKAAVISDFEGRNFYSIRIKDLTNNKWLKDEVKDTRNGCVWTKDNKTIVYGVPDKETLRVFQVSKHELGTDASEDVLLFQEDDPTLDIYVYASRSEEYVFVQCSRTDAATTYYASAVNPDKFLQIEPLEENIDYSVDHTGGNQFYIRTNYKSKNYRLCVAEIGKQGKGYWEDVIEGREDVFLTQVQFFRYFMVAEEMQNGLTTLRIIAKDRKDEYIKFDEPAYYATLSGNPEFNTNNFRYTYSSLITPYTTYEYDARTLSGKVIKQEIIPSGYDKKLYASERIMVKARDGKLVPMTVAYRIDKFKKDGSNAGFIYGYGAYGYSNEDYFDSNILSLLDRGFVYANTHIRGGQEMGGDWYLDGKMLNKKNTFYDFIDCSLWLQQNNYVSRDKLFANGGSAGGLLMGAISNMAPEVYKGIIADVPFVDAITTMEDETIPLTTFEWLEWGNPKIKEQYTYMMSYSPYDNVTAKNYPNMLVTTGLNDSQVQYFEPAKWVAKLRHTKTDSNLLLFKINMDAGHGGKSGRYEYYHEVAYMYAFMLYCLGEGN